MRSAAEFWGKILGSPNLPYQHGRGAYRDGAHAYWNVYVSLSAWSGAALGEELMEFRVALLEAAELHIASVFVMPCATSACMRGLSTRSS